MKKSEINRYIDKKIGLANRPTHEDVRNAMKFAYNLGSKNYMAKAKDYKNKAENLAKIISEQHSTNKAVVNFIKGLQSKISGLEDTKKKNDKEIERLKWLMGKSVTEFMSLNAKNNNIEEELRALAQSYLGMNYKDKGCKNWNEMQRKFAKDVLKILIKK